MDVLRQHTYNELEMHSYLTWKRHGSDLLFCSVASSAPVSQSASQFISFPEDDRCIRNTNLMADNYVVMNSKNTPGGNILISASLTDIFLKFIGECLREKKTVVESLLPVNYL